MTNITTLTATLKLAAQEEIMCRKASDTSDLWQDEASPENILVVVEALEKARVDGNEYAASERAVAVKNVELQDEIYGLKARIAELESRTVKLPKRSVGEVMHMSGFSRDYAEGWCSGNDNAIHEMRVAGIKWEDA